MILWFVCSEIQSLPVLVFTLSKEHDLWGHAVFAIASLWLLFLEKWDIGQDEVQGLLYQQQDLLTPLIP